MWKSLGRPDCALHEQGGGIDYGTYNLSIREKLLYTVENVGIALLLSWIFYHTWAAAVFMAPLVVYRIKEKQRELAEKRRQELTLQFRDAILAADAGLQAGYSIENAFLEARKDVAHLYGEGSLMDRELERLRAGAGNNIPLEKLMEDLGRRSKVADIEDFTQVFRIAKRSGGKLDEMIRGCVRVTSEKIEVNREIETMLAARRYEQKIMNLVPFMIFCYLQLTSPGFFAALYYNVTGVTIMTGCLAVYLTAFYLSVRIMNIKV